MLGPVQVSDTVQAVGTARFHLNDNSSSCIFLPEKEKLCMRNGENGFTITRCNTILYCDHWQPTVAFYRDTLMLEVNLETDWFAEFHITDGSYVSIADSKRATIAPAGGHGITFSFQIRDLDTVWRKLQSAGIGPSRIRQVWGAQAFHIHDPEGHRIEFWE